MNDDTQSIITLLSEHGPRLHATLLRITLREEVAEDLMQEKVAYAEVVAEIEHVKTIQYLETRTGKSPDGKLNSPTQVTQVTILGRSRERREVVSVKKGDPLTDGSGTYLLD